MTHKMKAGIYKRFAPDNGTLIYVRTDRTVAAIYRQYPTPAVHQVDGIKVATKDKEQGITFERNGCTWQARRVADVLPGLNPVGVLIRHAAVEWPHVEQAVVAPPGLEIHNDPTAPRLKSGPDGESVFLPSNIPRLRASTMVYVGPLEHLKGKTALVRPTDAPGSVLAQFDDREATLSGEPLPPRKELPFGNPLTGSRYAPPPADALGFGWSLFFASEFEDRVALAEAEPRYHSGGSPGLRPNEVPAILSQAREMRMPYEPGVGYGAASFLSAIKSSSDTEAALKAAGWRLCHAQSAAKHRKRGDRVIAVSPGRYAWRRDTLKDYQVIDEAHMPKVRRFAPPPRYFDETGAP